MYIKIWRGGRCGFIFCFQHLKMKMLNNGEITNEEVSIFSELKNTYPDYVFIRTEHGFDMSLSIQVTIDLSNILQVAIPAIVSIIEAILVYRIQKKQNELTEKKMKEDKIEMQRKQDNHSKNEFEVTVSSAGETKIIVKSSDLDALIKEPENLKAFMKIVDEELHSINE